MILTSDGRQFVYGVFVSDGYECTDLQSVWADYELAEQHAAYLKTIPDMFGPCGLYGERASVDVMSLQVHQTAAQKSRD